MIVLVVPKQIKIGAHTYKIKLDSNSLEDQGDYGSCNHRLQEILINRKRPPSQKLEVFLHECLHMIKNIYGISLEEAEIGRISEGFANALDSLGLTLDWSLLEQEQ